MSLDRIGQTARAVPTLELYGSGNDGDVTMPPGTNFLTRDMEYRNLTVPSGAVLQPNGWTVRVAGRLTVAVGGSIRADGQAATPGTVLAQNTSPVSYTASTAGFGGGSTVGSWPGGGNGGIGYGAAGNSGNAVSGSGSSGASGQGQAVFGSTQLAQRWGGGYGGGTIGGYARFTAPPFISWDTVLNIFSVGGGGGGGGAASGPAYAAVAGGAGGGGGGVIALFARTLQNDGVISAVGGAGANGAAATGGTSGTAAANGGTGGGGGVILIVARLRVGSGTFAADGGLGGQSAQTAQGINQAVSAAQANGSRAASGQVGTIVDLRF